LILGNEGARVVEQGGGTDFPVGSRMMFFGTYGAFEDGTDSEWVAVRKEGLRRDGAVGPFRSTGGDRRAGSVPGLGRLHFRDVTKPVKLELSEPESLRA